MNNNKEPNNNFIQQQNAQDNDETFYNPKGPEENEEIKLNDDKIAAPQGEQKVQESFLRWGLKAGYNYVLGGKQPIVKPQEGLAIDLGEEIGDNAAELKLQEEAALKAALEAELKLQEEAGLNQVNLDAKKQEDEKQAEKAAAKTALTNYNKTIAIVKAKAEEVMQKKASSPEILVLHLQEEVKLAEAALIVAKNLDLEKNKVVKNWKIQGLNTLIVQKDLVEKEIKEAQNNVENQSLEPVKNEGVKQDQNLEEIKATPEEKLQVIANLISKFEDNTILVDEQKTKMSDNSALYYEQLLKELKIEEQKAIIAKGLTQSECVMKLRHFQVLHTTALDNFAQFNKDIGKVNSEIDNADMHVFNTYNETFKKDPIEHKAAFVVALEGLYGLENTTAVEKLFNAIQSQCGKGEHITQKNFDKLKQTDGFIAPMMVLLKDLILYAVQAITNKVMGGEEMSGLENKETYKSVVKDVMANLQQASKEEGKETSESQALDNYSNAKKSFVKKEETKIKLDIDQVLV